MARGTEHSVKEFRDEATGFVGWRARLERGREIPTPALAGETVVVGGGFGSDEVFALDARSGEARWHRRTSDDGPTAATLAGRHVAYDTESCTVEVLDVETGSAPSRWARAASSGAWASSTT